MKSSSMNYSPQSYHLYFERIRGNFKPRYVRSIRDMKSRPLCFIFCNNVVFSHQGVYVTQISAITPRNVVPKRPISLFSVCEEFPYGSAERERVRLWTPLDVFWTTVIINARI